MSSARRGLVLNRKLIIGTCGILLLSGMVAAYFGFAKSDELIAMQVDEAPRPVTDLEFTKQHKFVTLDQGILEGLVHNVNQIQLALFNGERVKIKINDRQPINDQDAIAYGEVESDPGSTVVLSMAGDSDGGKTEAMSGTIDFTDGRSFKIDYVGDGVHKLVEIDHSSYEGVCNHPAGPAGFILGPKGEKIQLMYQHIVMRGGPQIRVPRVGVAQSLTPAGRQIRLGASPADSRAFVRLPARSISQPRNTWSFGKGRSSGGATYRPMNWASFRSGPNVVFGGKTSSGSSGGGGGGGTNPPPPPGGGGGGTNPPPPPGGGGNSKPPDANPEIDILVVYTDGAAQAKGGDAGIKAEAGVAVGNVNTAFKNSGLKCTAKLAGTAKWNHTSSGNLSSDITALSKDAAITSLRTSNKADLVAAIVPGAASGNTGIGSLPSGTGGNKAACWSVTKVSAIGAPARSFTHEIGHNLGCGHAKDQGGSGGAESTSYGWRFSGSDGKNYRTLLSYQKNPTEPRIPYFSNPSVNYQGTATGNAGANNAGTISKLAPKVAGYN